MKIFYDTNCKLCRASIKPYVNDPTIELCEAVSHETIVIKHKQKTYVKSDAIILLLSTKHRAYKLLKIVPRFLRDFVYDVVAKYRHKF